MKKIVAIIAIVVFTGGMAMSASANVASVKAQYSVTDQDPKKKETAKKSSENKSEASKEKSCESKTTESKSGCCKSSCEGEKK